MASSEEKYDHDINELADTFQNKLQIDKGQQTLDIQEYWIEAKIRITDGENVEEKILNGTPACLQYMVQRKSEALKEMLKEFGCCVDEKNSQKFLTLYLEKKLPSKQFWNSSNFEKIYEKIEVECEGIYLKQISLKENKLPFIEREFCEVEKKSLENGGIQVIKKTNEIYIVVGFKSDVKKSIASLERLCKEVSVEDIEDRELFEVLKVKENLKAKFNVKISEEKSRLVFRGPEKDVADCSHLYKIWSALQLPCKKSMKISENLYSKLISDQKREDIYRSLKKKGLCVYWKVSCNEHCYFLICYGLTEEGLEDTLDFVKREGDEIDQSARMKNLQKVHFEHTAGVLRIKRGISYDYLKSKKKEIEEKMSCSILLAKRETEEPAYYKSWMSNNRNIVIAEGNVENSVTDIIICPVNENFEPADESAERIFLKGGWTELESAAQYCKNNCKFHDKPAMEDVKNCICLSSTTGSLNCRKILFLSLKENMELLLSNLCLEIIKDRWRSIYFSIDHLQMTNGMVESILTYFSQRTKSFFYFEIVLCIPRGRREILKHLMHMCEKQLNCSSISFYTEDTGNNEDAVTCSCLPSPTEVQIKTGSILDFAIEVDAIVNSTNTSLGLHEGFVSKLILKYGGMDIQENLQASYKGGIGIGDVAVSVPGKLKCRSIIHCVLYDWISTGNLSCKILSSVVKKCLHAMESHGYQTIAIPALGTGKLKYSYLHVARTMLKAVEEYGKAFPNTCIKKVIIVLHESDQECMQTFSHVFGTKPHANDFSIKELIQRPRIQFLEYRMYTQGLWIQLMSEEIDEPVDAIIKFTQASSSTSKHKGNQIPVDLAWSKEKGCYTATFNLDHQSESVESAVGKCFNLLQSKRMTSTRIDIKDIGANGDFEKVMGAFCKKLNSSFLGSLKTNTEKEEIRYLRTLQILTHQTEIEKLKHHNVQQKKAAGSYIPTWITNLLKTGGCDKEWKVVDRKKKNALVCCVIGPTKENTEGALEDLKREIGVDSMEPRRYCFMRDYKWKLLSKVCNIKLCDAEENGLQFVDIKSEDGITYSYNLEEMERKQKNRGDARKEILLCIQSNSPIPFPPKSPLWCVHQNQTWTFLPLRCCELLNKAVMERKQFVFDDENYEYDLNNLKREKYTADSGRICEEIIFVDADKSKESVPVKKMDNENEIFESVSGKISYEEEGTDRDKNKIQRVLGELGCTVISTKNNCYEIKGNLSQIKKICELFRNERKETVPSGDESFSSVVSIPMSERDYKILKHFGDNRNWFKKHNNAINFDGQGLSCVVQIDEHENIKEEIGKRLEEVRMMTSTSYQTTDESKKLVQVLADQYPNVCFLVNDKSTEIISDSYDDFVRLQEMLKPKEQAKKNRRAARTFAKSDTSEAQEALPSSNDVYSAAGNRYETNTPNSQTMAQPRALELKTAEGLLIKIYAGSITRLDVDCIVNAANEQLMHGGGVAAAISDAAGYQFDQESKQYIVDNGSLQVGSCCVTSAGKLRYKYVIHTVGPRWYDYNDKSRCMWDLQKSVMVTFEKADELKMKSIAIPAISSGIFAVPRDVCVEQYYKATMSFSSTHSCQSLKEIHFVDRDESMVKAIQELFLQKLPPTSSIITEMSGNHNEQVDTPEDSKSTDKRDPLETPPSNSYTIVTVTDTLQIKIYLGNVTDIVADVIVCPQDELCSSDSQIARDIFSKNAGSKPLSGEMRFGKILCQTPHKTSSWKMVIHAVFPIYDDIYSKDPAKFGSQFYSMIQSIIETADKERYNSIVIPLLSEGKGEYQAPVELCALNFHRAVKELKSTLLCMKEIYLVLRKKGDESIFVEIFSDAYKITERPLQKKFGSDQTFEKTLTSKPVEEETCCICMDIPKNPKKLPNCGHVFCKVCIEESFKYKPACPSCGQIYGKMTGDQPPGTISIRKEYQTLEGFSECKGTIVLTYNLPNGVQGDENPNPGASYKGIYRSGYVPNNEKGRLVAKLLNVAFSRRLVFTIGHSRTTGEDGVITWNDIHHKTRTHGGPQRFGYPDPTYLDRVMEELAVKGVTPESADDPQEYKEYSRVFRY